MCLSAVTWGTLQWEPSKNNISNSICSASIFYRCDKTTEEAPKIYILTIFQKLYVSKVNVFEYFQKIGRTSFFLVADTNQSLTLLRKGSYWNPRHYHNRELVVTPQPLLCFPTETNHVLNCGLIALICCIASSPSKQKQCSWRQVSDTRHCLTHTI